MTDPAPIDRRQLIASAAADLIGRDGLPTLSHRAVAREAGVPLTAVSYYFGSKDALLAAAIDHITNTELELVKAVAHQLLGTERLHFSDAAKACADLVRMLVSTDRSNRIGHLEAMMYALRQDPPLPAASAWWQANIDATRDILEAVGLADPEVDAHVVFGTAFGLYFAELTSPSPCQGGDVLARSFDRLFQALDSRDLNA